AGLEPATSWLQAPPRFRGAWTISSPWATASRRPPVGGGRFPRLVAGGRPHGSSLCTVLRASPPRGFAQDSPIRPRGAPAHLGSPDFARFSIPPSGRDAATLTATCSTG